MDRSHGRGPAWWRGLTPAARLSLLGLVAAGLLALGLAAYIPDQVKHNLLNSELDVDHQMLGAFVSSGALDPNGAPGAGLDHMVRATLLQGDYVRVKLWRPDGLIAYSDDPVLIGRTFPVKDELAEAFAGQARHDISDLRAPENVQERALAKRLLEIYLPVNEGGRVVAVWEVYRSLDRLDAALVRVRRAVWASVAAGLGLLLVFLVSSFGTLLGSVQRRREEAESRARQLEAAQIERQRLLTSLVSAQEDERQRIVGEIHDGLGQDLHRVLFGLRGCRAGTAGCAEELAGLEELVEQSSRKLRRLLADLRPSTIDDVGLVASLRSLVDRVQRDDGLEVDFSGDGLTESAVPVPVRLAVFRIVQEALRNVARHAGTGRADVSLDADGQGLTVRIADAGPGFAPPAGDGVGLSLMRERAEACGGTLAVESGPQGTTLVARIPLGGNS